MTIQNILKNIKEGLFSSVVQGNAFSHDLKSARELEQIMSVCSHFVYSSEFISCSQLTSILNMLQILLSSARLKELDITSELIVKSLCYILIYGAKKGFSPDQVLKMCSEIESVLTFEGSFCSNNSATVRKIYTVLWNLSLENTIEKEDSLKLQMHSLHFLFFSGENLSVVCQHCLRVGKTADTNMCRKALIATLYERVLCCISKCLYKKPQISADSVFNLNLVCIEYSKALLLLGKSGDFSKAFRPLAASLESVCAMKITVSYKMSVKLLEAGMALTLKQCNETTFMKILRTCSVISTSDIIANSVIMESLLQIVEYFTINNRSDSLYKCSAEVFKELLEAVCGRMRDGSLIVTESAVKVLEMFGDIMNKYCNVMSGASPDSRQCYLRETQYFARLIKNCLNIELEASDRIEICIYNIGVNSCNAGVYAYRWEEFGASGDLFDAGVSYLHYCYKVFNRTTALDIIKKKAYVLKDSLRLAGSFQEATKKTVELVLVGIIPPEEIVTTWVKCKRDDKKTGKNYLKKVTIKHIIDELMSEKEELSKELKVEDLLLQEISGLKDLCMDLVESELACSKALIASGNLAYQVEGLLCLTQILWSHPMYPSEDLGSAMDAVRRAYELLNCNQGLAKELRARTHFWLYLCCLQATQRQMECKLLEVDDGEHLYLTTPSTDLGEEVQPDDACNIRLYVSRSSFSLQEKSLKHLNKSLHLWKEAANLLNTQSARRACNILLSIGYIYKLSGLLYSSLDAFAVMLAISEKNGFHEYWINGIVEIIQVVPEVLPEKIVDRLLSLLDKEQDKKNPVTNYLKYEAFATVAYFYYKTGKYENGVRLLNQCLFDPIMDKKTPLGLEVQILIYFVASLYATLPKNLLPHEWKLQDPCLVLALAATRKAIGLIMAEIDNNSGTICHSYKIAWLHHETNMWFGRLCHITAQPRQARAYLRQMLALAEKFTLPLRIAESLSLLAEVDLQCDQLDDCRTKIASVNNLLQIHGDVKRNKYNKGGGLTLARCSKTAEEEIICGGTGSTAIYEDALGERLRESGVSPEYKLNAPSNELIGHIIIGEPDRIGQLANPNIHSLSPSLLRTEEDFVVRKGSCPVGVESCVICSIPEVHTVAVRCASMLAIVHSQQDNKRGALKCLNQASHQLELLEDSAPRIVSKLVSFLSCIDKPAGICIPSSEIQNISFIQSKLALTKFLHYFNYQEVLCLEKEFDEAYLRSVTVMKEVSQMCSTIILQHPSVIVQLILQAKALHKIHHSSSQVESGEIECTQFLSPKVNAGFKTPAKYVSKCDSHLRTPAGSVRAKSVNCLKQKKHLLTTPFAPIKGRQLPATPFRIFVDELDCDTPTVVQTTPKTRPRGRKGTNEGEDELDATFAEFIIKDPSPFSELLGLPQSEQLVRGPARATRSYTAAKKAAVEGEEPPDKTGTNASSLTDENLPDRELRVKGSRSRNQQNRNIDDVDPKTFRKNRSSRKI